MLDKNEKAGAVGGAGGSTQRPISNASSVWSETPKSRDIIIAWFKARFLHSLTTGALERTVRATNALE